MIKINLLPVKRSKKRDTATRELAIAGGIIGVVLLVLYVWYAIMDSRIGTVQERVAKTKREIQGVEQKIVQVEEFKKKKREFEQKLEVIDDLKAKKTGPVKLLDELAINMPKRVWLQSLEEKGGSMIMEGGAADNDELSDFLAYLTKRSRYFSNVTLVFSETTQTGKEGPAAAGTAARKISYVKFKVNGSAIYGVRAVAAAAADKKVPQ